MVMSYCENEKIPSRGIKDRTLQAIAAVLNHTNFYAAAQTDSYVVQHTDILFLFVDLEKCLIY